MPLAAIRGAITLDDDTRDEILDRTEELVRAVLDQNGLDTDDIVSMTFTATADLHAEFPALAVRRMGITDIPLLCACEMEVPGALERCVRLLVYVETPRARRSFTHVYLRDAAALRPDLLQR